MAKRAAVRAPADLTYEQAFQGLEAVVHQLEAGEGSLSAFLPALTNAIADAIGLRLDELPASPDRVLEAIVARRRAERVRRTAKAAAQEAH